MGMVDYYLWPHFERLSALRTRLNIELMPKGRFPKLTAWVAAMKSTPGVKGTLTSDADHKGYIDSVNNGGSNGPNYDLGL